MTSDERMMAAVSVLARHARVVWSRPNIHLFDYQHLCVCGQTWNLKHQAQELDKAGLLCALAEDY